VSTQFNTIQCYLRVSSGQAELAQSEPARIYMWTIHRIEYEGTDVQLYCRAAGNPAPKVTWYDRDDNKITGNDANYRVSCASVSYLLGTSVAYIMYHITGDWWVISISIVITLKESYSVLLSVLNINIHVRFTLYTFSYSVQFILLLTFADSADVMLNLLRSRRQSH